MLHFLSGVYASLFSDVEYGVLLVGAESAGKTTLLEQLKYMYNRPDVNDAVMRSAAATTETDTTAASLCTADDSGNNSVGCSNATTPHNDSTSSSNHIRNRATRAYMASRRIRPTIGVNVTHVLHRYNASTTTTATAAATTSATAALRTRLQLWDVGGQRALRPLWVSYFRACQAVIFVVDSTLPYAHATKATTTATTMTTVTSDAALHNSDSNDSHHHDGVAIMRTNGYAHYNNNNDNKSNNDNNDDNNSNDTHVDGDAVTRQAMRDAHRGNRALLRRLLLHPALRMVPFLVLSNKTDATPHMSLAQVQDALGVVDLALHASFYEHEHEAQTNDTTRTSSRRNSNCSNCSSNATHADDDDDDDAVASLQSSMTTHAASTSDTTTTTTTATPNRTDETCSGFGSITWKLLEVSALDGDGVAMAMDWLVTQLRRHARVVDIDDEAR